MGKSSLLIAHCSLQTKHSNVNSFLRRLENLFLSVVNSRLNQLTMKSHLRYILPVIAFTFLEFNACEEEAATNEQKAKVEQQDTANQNKSSGQNATTTTAVNSNPQPGIISFHPVRQKIMISDQSTVESQNRVELINKPISFRTESGRAPVKHRFYHLAEVSAPLSPHGDPLSATCVQIEGNYAFVSWHWNRGESDYYGALEIYNLSDPEVPKLQSSLTAANIDFNHLYADIDERGKGKVYAVGSENAQAGELTSPAYFGEFPVKNYRFQNEVTGREDLKSYSGNCVIKHSGNLYTVSGHSKGAFTKLDPKTGKTTNLFQLDGLKYLAANDKFIIMLKQGRPQSQLAVYDSKNPDFKKPLRTISVGGITPRNGKNVVYIDGDFAYISTGKLGMKVYDLLTSSSTPFYTYHTLLPGTTNGVAADEDYIYIANGSSGLHVLHKNGLLLAGNFSHRGSANFVAAGDRHIITANGKGGLTLMRKKKVNT